MYENGLATLKFWWGETLDPKDRKLWTLTFVNVPNIIQVFTWKAAGNALPARNVLHTRMPMLSVDCTRCNDPHESVFHALVLCPFASRVWFLSSFCVNTHFFNNKSFLDWMMFWLIDPISKLHERDQYLFVVILWSLWQSRNNLFFQNIKETHSTVLMRARAMLLTRKPCPIISNTVSFGYYDKWIPPPTRWIKFNTDGAYDPVSGNNGAGYVMRGFSNTASFCASIVFGVESAEEAEARAIWEALKKAVEQKLTHIIIESDAQNLINQFSVGLFDGDTMTDVIFKDIQFFSSSQGACLFVFQPRICNFVAHELAHWAKTNNSTMYWSTPPIWLLPIVEGDH
ncbi:uncharacterized protein LOC113272753 [Papaver somniferum]|uniref:uncharacterized protein LOC113272753 n=1 Tax=Papaver somniferum TaxID=3469 RepID=UPI000E6F55FC|nr:uncharacterized protein LOC113272753 [Papaver somniferum]